MKKRICALLSIALVAGCNPGAEVTTPPQSVTLLNANAESRVARYEEQTIRTRIREVPGDPTKEIVGIPCRATSAEIAFAFVTPARVFVPVFKGKPTPLRVTCDYQDMPVNKVLPPNLNGQVVGGLSPAGLVAAAVTAGIAAGRDEWSYPIGSTGVAISEALIVNE